MALWMVRAGAQGQHETLALEKNVVVIGWSELGDLSKLKTREELLDLITRIYPDAKPRAISNWASQIWAFVATIQAGDLVALPLKQRPTIAFGRVTGPYRYCADFPEGARHTRPVKWIQEIPRSTFEQDLLYSFGAFLTVCRIRRNDAEQRIEALLEGKQSPPPSLEIEPEEGGALADLEEIALDQIRSYVERRFAGHRLTDLVAAVLTAQGYKVRVSPAGPDGGVDILAGSGPMGLESPHIAVQVKSGNTPVDVMTVHQLQGAMKNFRADRGLFVAWAGYKRSVAKEAAHLFFEVRLWDSDDLLREVLKHYDDLPEDLQAELPLKRIWVLVPSEETTP